MDILSEIEAMKAVAEVLESVEPEARNRVLSWAVSAYLPNFKELKVSQIDDQLHHKSAGTKKAKNPLSKPKGLKIKKTKSSLKILKEINFKPSGKKSASDFVSEKVPGSHLEKCTVAVYYLRETLKIEVVSVDHVYTFFKALGWRLPHNLSNTLQQAGSKGWLDTSSSQDVKLGTMGENLVEHDLPKKKK